MIQAKYCPRCLSPRSFGDTFCWECGAELTLEPPFRCNKCKAVLSPADRFCSNCGVKVK